MVKLMIAQFETELRWLDALEREVKHRGKAQYPEYASGEEGK